MASGKTLLLIGGEFMKWEYLFIEYGHGGDQSLNKLNELGEAEWEAVASVGTEETGLAIIMKRPKGK